MRNIKLPISLIKELKRANVIALYLHGSKVKGTALPDSDSDIAVVVPDLKKVDKLELMTKTAGQLPFKDPDVRVVDSNSSPVFLFSIIKYGKILYEENRQETISFESFVMKNYYYTQRIRDIYRNYIYSSFV